MCVLNPLTPPLWTQTSYLGHLVRCYYHLATKTPIRPQNFISLANSPNLILYFYRIHITISSGFYLDLSCQSKGLQREIVWWVYFSNSSDQDKLLLSVESNRSYHDKNSLIFNKIGPCCPQTTHFYNTQSNSQFTMVV